MVSNGNNYLAIYDFHTDSKKRLPLPRDIGPLLYFDSNGNQAYDLIYLSIENGKSFLNIHRNQSVPDFKKVDLAKPEDYFNKVDPPVIYNNEPDFKADLLISVNGTAVLRDGNDMPTGLFLTDINSDGGRGIIVTMRDGAETRLRCLEYEKDGLRVSEYDETISKYENVLSVSAIDIYDRGKDDLLINCVVDGRPVLIVERIPSPDVNCKLSALACLSNINHSMAHLPGVTYLVHYDNGTKWRKMSQMTATSYGSLQHQSAYIGLGQTNFFLNFVMARTNSAERNYDHYIVRGIIVPNTSIVFLVMRDKWIKQNFFLLNRYYIVATSLVGLLVFNLAILKF